MSVVIGVHGVPVHPDEGDADGSGHAPQGVRFGINFFSPEMHSAIGEEIFRKNFSSKIKMRVTGYLRP